MMRVLLRAIFRADRGIAALEFALLAPVLILTLVGIADLSILVHDQVQISQALDAGAQYAYRQGQSESGSTLTTDVGSFVNAVSRITLSSVTASYNGGLLSGSCYCVAGASPTYTGPVTCGATCTDGSGSTAGKFVSITGTLHPSALFSVDKYFMPTSLTSTVTVRLQ